MICHVCDQPSDDGHDHTWADVQGVMDEETRQALREGNTPLQVALRESLAKYPPPPGGPHQIDPRWLRLAQAADALVARGTLTFDDKTTVAYAFVAPIELRDDLADALDEVQRIGEKD